MRLLGPTFRASGVFGMFGQSLRVLARRSWRAPIWIHFGFQFCSIPPPHFAPGEQKGTATGLRAYTATELLIVITRSTPLSEANQDRLSRERTSHMMRALEDPRSACTAARMLCRCDRAEVPTAFQQTSPSS